MNKTTKQIISKWPNYNKDEHDHKSLKHLFRQMELIIDNDEHFYNLVQNVVKRDNYTIYELELVTSLLLDNIKKLAN